MRCCTLFQMVFDILNSYWKREKRQQGMFHVIILYISISSNSSDLSLQTRGKQNEIVKRWIDYLTNANRSYNCTIHNTTKQTPFHMMFGRDPPQQWSTLSVLLKSNSVSYQ